MVKALLQKKKLLMVIFSLTFTDCKITNLVNLLHKQSVQSTSIRIIVILKAYFFTDAEN